MKPTSKVIKTFMVNHEYTRSGGEYHSEENNNYLIVHCEDGSIWKTTQDILYMEDEDWECILEAPSKEQVLTSELNHNGNSNNQQS
jgi:hypothetical protein